MKRQWRNINVGKTMGEKCLGGRPPPLPDGTVTGYTSFDKNGDRRNVAGGVHSTNESGKRTNG